MYARFRCTSPHEYRACRFSLEVRAQQLSLRRLLCSRLQKIPGLLLFIPLELRRFSFISSLIRG